MSTGRSMDRIALSNFETAIPGKVMPPSLPERVTLPHTRSMDQEVYSESGIPIAVSYGPADLPPAEALPPPGVFPFTRGNFPDGYRGRVWTVRQYSGFGTAEESNSRYRYLLAQGGTGLSVALDLPTQCGYDSDDPEVEEEVGRVGVAIDTLADVEILFDGIPLAKLR